MSVLDVVRRKSYGDEVAILLRSERMSIKIRVRISVDRGERVYHLNDVSVLLKFFEWWQSHVSTIIDMTRSCVSTRSLPLGRESRWDHIHSLGCHVSYRRADDRTKESNSTRRKRLRRWEYVSCSSAGGHKRWVPLSPLTGDLERLAMQLQVSLQLFISRTGRVDRSRGKHDCEIISKVRMIVFGSTLCRKSTLTCLKNMLSRSSCVVILSLKKWSLPKIVVCIRVSFRTMSLNDLSIRNSLKSTGNKTDRTVSYMSPHRGNDLFERCK